MCSHYKLAAEAGKKAVRLECRSPRRCSCLCYARLREDTGTGESATGIGSKVWNKGLKSMTKLAAALRKPLRFWLTDANLDNNCAPAQFRRDMQSRHCKDPDCSLEQPDRFGCSKLSSTGE